MLAVSVIDDPGAAIAALDPVRAALLAQLGEPASAAALAARTSLPRQRLNYHLRALEAHGLVRVAEQRRWGGITERRLVATAAAYLVSPAALGPLAPDPARSGDALSASFLIALAARAVREVHELWCRARERGQRLATLAIDTEVRFRTPAERAAFTRELGEAIAALVARYHDAQAPGGRAHRLLVAAHPLPVAPEAPDGNGATAPGPEPAATDDAAAARDAG